MAARTARSAPSAPDALDAAAALGTAAGPDGLPRVTAGLVHLRASQLTGCRACVQLQARDLKNAGESDERIWAVAAWRDAPFFTAAERAALALTEAVTRLGGPGDPVPDDAFAEAGRHFEEPALATLTLHITLIKAWNRLSVTNRQVAGG